jgi:hypothetical protein
MHVMQVLGDLGHAIVAWAICNSCSAMACRDLAIGPHVSDLPVVAEAGPLGRRKPSCVVTTKSQIHFVCTTRIVCTAGNTEAEFAVSQQRHNTAPGHSSIRN